MYGKTLVVLVAAAAVSGCVIVAGGDRSKYSSGWETRQELNRSVIPQLPLGTPIATVTGRLGEPDFAEAFGLADGEYRALFYRTHHTKSDGRTTRNETTPVVFRDGQLIGIGDDYYRRLTGG